jgi:ubiquinone/menaquinone biosynthesis C-methylase UbiE
LKNTLFPSFSGRASGPEIMDDLSQPEHEFAEAYRELEIINRNLGGVRAIERFLPETTRESRLLDVAAGGCDISETLLRKKNFKIVALDLNDRGLKLARKSLPVVGDAFDLPFRDGSFDVVMSTQFFHHLTNDQCVRVLRQMWRIARTRIIVNDLHRHAVAYFSIRVLTSLFSKSRMVRNDGPLSVRRAFRPGELMEIARQAKVPARIYRSFPYHLVLVADK